MLELRPLELTEIDEIRKIRNKYYMYLRQPYPFSEGQQYNWYTNLKDHIYFSIYNERNELLGATGFTYPDWINKKVELSFIIENYVDEIITPEVINLSLKKIFKELNFNKCYVIIYEFDPKIEYLIKTGFVLDGELRQDYYYDGKYWDSFVYSILRNEYENIY